MKTKEIKIHFSHYGKLRLCKVQSTATGSTEDNQKIKHLIEESPNLFKYVLEKDYGFIGVDYEGRFKSSYNGVLAAVKQSLNKKESSMI